MVLHCFQNVLPLGWFLLKSVIIYPLFYTQDRRWQACSLEPPRDSDLTQGFWNIDHRAAECDANFYILFWVESCQVRYQACRNTAILTHLLTIGSWKVHPVLLIFIVKDLVVSLAGLHTWFHLSDASLSLCSISYTMEINIKLCFFAIKIAE